MMKLLVIILFTCFAQTGSLYCYVVLAHVTCLKFFTCSFLFAAGISLQNECIPIRFFLEYLRKEAGHQIIFTGKQYTLLTSFLQFFHSRLPSSH